MVIIMSGHGTIETAVKATKLGAFDFIEKTDTAVDDLINAVQRAIDHLDEKIKRSGNPFTPMTGVEPTVFGGRTQELEFFEQRLNRALHSRFCEHFLVLGNWGIGKSTLLKEYKKICQSRHSQGKCHRQSNDKTNDHDDRDHCQHCLFPPFLSYNDRTSKINIMTMDAGKAALRYNLERRNETAYWLATDIVYNSE